MIPEQELQELERLEKAATPGPWDFSGESWGGMEWREYVVKAVQGSDVAQKRVVANCRYGNNPGREDAEFIAVVRVLLPQLLSSYRELQAENEKTQENDQSRVDRLIYYRNLAIELGAKPDDMTDSYDRNLCEKWETYQSDDDHRFSWERDEQQAAWKQVEDLEAENEELRADFVRAVEIADQEAQYADGMNRTAQDLEAELERTRNLCVVLESQVASDDIEFDKDNGGEGDDNKWRFIPTTLEDEIYLDDGVPVR